MRSQSAHRGFTLLELVFVLVIICTVLAMAAPSLRGWSQGSRLRDTADALLATTRLARTQAVATGQVHRLNIDPANGQYQLVVQQGEEFVPVAGGFGAPSMLPEGYRIELAQALPAGDSSISFTPTGRTQPARIRITSEQGESVEIECTTPAELFRVVGP
jgi:type II secretion system protein H